MCPMGLFSCFLYFHVLFRLLNCFVLFAIVVTHTPFFLYKNITGIIRKIEERRLIQIDFLLYASPDSKLSNRKRGQRKRDIEKMVVNSETALVINFRRFWTRALSNAPRKDRRSWSSVTFLNSWHFGILNLS